MTPSEHEHRGEEPAPSATARLRASLLRPSRGQLAVGVLLALLGAATVTQVRLANTDDTYAGMRQPELIEVLNGLNAAARRAERDIDELQRTRSSLQSTTDRRQAAIKQAQAELVSLGILAGTLPATGPGVRITVQVTDDDLRISQLLDGIEELRDAGAEAMEINDSVRVVAQTSFEDAADGGIEVDGAVLHAPYTIDAIGDADGLATAMRIPGGFVEDLEKSGKVDIEKLDKVEVTVLRNAVQPRFAQPVE